MKVDANTPSHVIVRLGYLHESISDNYTLAQLDVPLTTPDGTYSPRLSSTLGMCVKLTTAKGQPPNLDGLYTWDAGCLHLDEFQPAVVADEDSIAVAWDDRQFPDDSTVDRKIRLTNHSDNTETETSVSAGTTFHVFEGLDKDTYYGVSMTFSTLPWSKPLTVYTAKGGGATPVMREFVSLTRREGLNRTSDSIQVTWEEADPVQYGAGIWSYQMQVKPTDAGWGDDSVIGLGAMCCGRVVYDYNMSSVLTNHPDNPHYRDWLELNNLFNSDPKAAYELYKQKLADGDYDHYTPGQRAHLKIAHMEPNKAYDIRVRAKTHSGRWSRWMEAPHHCDPLGGYCATRTARLQRPRWRGCPLVDGILSK